MAAMIPIERKNATGCTGSTWRSAAATGWRTSAGGRYKPAGAGQGISGYGAHLLLIDDPHKDTEAYSEAVCDALWRWYLSSAVTRLMPDAGQLVIMTRWTLFDLCGRLLDEEGSLDEGGKWEVVTYPALAVKDEFRDPRTGVISAEAAEGLELMRTAGTPLHPERYSLAALSEIRDRDPVVWSALYQQDPLAADVTLFSDLDRTACFLADIPPLDSMIAYATWDLASGQKDVTKSAFTARVQVHMDRAGVFWVTDVFRCRDDMYDVAERILAEYEQLNHDIVGLEDTQAAVALMPFLERLARERGVHNLPVTLLKVRGQDKVARAGPIQALIRQGMVRIPSDAPWAGDFLKELRSFPNGRYKDMVDAFAWVGQIANNMQYYARQVARPGGVPGGVVDRRLPFSEPRLVRQGPLKRWKTA